MTKDELFTTLQADYGNYREALEDIEAELDVIRAEKIKPMREELSRKMHESHAAGLSKDRIRRAVKAYGNGWIFDPLWEAWTPETATDLRRRTTTEAGTTQTEDHEWAGDDLILTLPDGEKVTLVNCATVDVDYVEWDNFEATSTEHPDQISYLTVTAHRLATEHERED